MTLNIETNRSTNPKIEDEDFLAPLPQKKTPKTKAHDVAPFHYAQANRLLAKNGHSGKGVEIIFGSKPNFASKVSSAKVSVETQALKVVSDALGKDTLKSRSFTGGEILFTTTYGEGKRVKIRVEENSLKGLSGDQRDKVERALERMAIISPSQGGHIVTTFHTIKISALAPR